MGDCNARVGEQQIIPEEIFCNSPELVKADCSTVRKSKDVKLDARGKKLIEFFDLYNLVILNGRTPGDMLGEFTYISSNGCSVIDLCSVTSDLIPRIENFQVGKQLFSDHLPIVLHIYCNEICNDDDVLPLLPKLQWNNNMKCGFEEKLKRQLETFDISSVNVLTLTDYLIHCIWECVPSRIVKQKNKLLNFQARNVWFDGDCLKARCRSFSVLKLFRKTNSTIVKAAYLRENRLYKALCKKKEIDFFKTTGDQISSVKDSRQFWKLVNRCKNKAHLCSNKIVPSVWRDYFISLYSPGWDASPILWVEPSVVDPSLDCTFKEEELSLVLSQAKDNKAPGTDRVPSEFLKNSPKIFQDYLLYAFNEFYNRGIVPTSFEMGVRQGCLLSPLLFALYILDLPEYVGGGLMVGQTKVNILMYADDIVLLAEDAKVLQVMIQRLGNVVRGTVRVKSGHIKESQLRL
ncbi:uncharacterized protein [Rhodnius prolixus]|uniref:uncharacterized protein n=1 Tax=Rhodnius prolixus TaxID=13249 RepID=UPI003D18B479